MSAEDKMTPEKANESRVLLNEDIRKYELAKARAYAQIAQFDAAIAECELAISDIDRREAGVEYPQPEPEKVEKAKPAMGEPVGGAAK